MTIKRWGLRAIVAGALLSTSVAQNGPFLIDIDSTVSGAGSIATELGWSSLDATLGDASPGVTVNGVLFSISSADGSRIRARGLTDGRGTFEAPGVGSKAFVVVSKKDRYGVAQ